LRAGFWFIFLAAHLIPTLATAQPTPTRITDAESCPKCSIKTEVIATLGTIDGGGAIGESISSVAVDVVAAPANYGRFIAS
jgi:hypothetical protein